MKQLHPKQKRIAAAAALALVAGTGWWIWTSRFEDTDNAYTSAHVATLSPKVAGLVAEVLVEENTRVKKDQVLVRLDSREYLNARDRLAGELGAVEASVSLARKEDRRATLLFSQQVVSEQDRDRESAKLAELLRRRDALKAQLTEAELDLSYVEIRAPEDGTIGKKLAEPGMMVSPGQPLLSFVDARAPWIVANFKETQLKKMRAGQECEIEIDSIGGKTFTGVVESFSPGTGAVFALIPPDNATGNFTKIVQRVPVRIRFDAESIRGYEDRIVPGLSAEAKVYLREGPAPAEPAPGDRLSSTR